MGKHESTLYLAYLISKDAPPDLYAWTMDKHMMYGFLAQRNPKCFYMKKVPVKYSDSNLIKRDFEAGQFMTENSEKKLIYDTLWDGKQDYKAILTANEGSLISEEYDSIISVLHDIHAFVIAIEDLDGIEPKYIKILQKITSDVVRIRHLDRSDINVDTFSIFCNLFKDTLYMDDG